MGKVLIRSSVSRSRQSHVHWSRADDLERSFSQCERLEWRKILLSLRISRDLFEMISFDSEAWLDRDEKRRQRSNVITVIHPRAQFHTQRVKNSKLWQQIYAQLMFCCVFVAPQWAEELQCSRWQYRDNFQHRLLSSRVVYLNFANTWASEFFSLVTGAFAM